MWPHPPPIRLSRFLSPPPSSPQDQFGCPFSRDPLSPRAGTGGPPPGSTFVNLASAGVFEEDEESTPINLEGDLNTRGTVHLKASWSLSKSGETLAEQMLLLSERCVAFGEQNYPARRALNPLALFALYR